jgi:NDP-sugar pyrophosphorylase family protein
VIKKYELTNESVVMSGDTLAYRIRALRDFSDVRKGDLGGYVENEDNLSHDGDCWVYDDARVSKNAVVIDDAKIMDYVWISEDARVTGRSVVSGDSWVRSGSVISDNAIVKGWARIHDSEVSGHAIISGRTRITKSSKISGNCVLNFNMSMLLSHLTLDRGVWDSYYTDAGGAYISSKTLEVLRVDNG